MSRYISQYERERKTTPKPRASLAALQWMAEKAGQSYGVFTQHLTPDDEARIQEEFDACKAEREGAAEARRVACVENDTPSPYVFILTDEGA